MAVTAKVICDSISDEGIRLTTLQLRYPRMVHADFMTHRVFSRNGRSSRAVPFATLVKEVPYVPAFAANQKGMVAGEALTGDMLEQAERVWLNAALYCQKAAAELADLNVHKQWVNRMLEWFGYIDVLVSSTDWSNFFELRDEDGAQPEIIQLAKAIKAAINGSTPAKCLPGSWHLPYVDAVLEVRGVGEFLNEKQPGWDNGLSLEQQGNKLLEVLRKISVARCARLTIKPFDGNASIEAELKRYSLLMESRPVHSSPAEHIATPDHASHTSVNWYGELKWDHPKEHGNFYGWRQFRKMIPYNTIYDR